MATEIKKVIVAASLALVAVLGAAAPALADGGSFNVCLPAWR